MDGLWSTGIVVDLGQPQVDRLRHADDLVQAGLPEHLPKTPGRSDHRDPRQLLPGAADGADQSGESGTVEKCTPDKSTIRPGSPRHRPTAPLNVESVVASRSPLGEQVAVPLVVATSTSSMWFYS
jgi:hypothetical protein